MEATAALGRALGSRARPGDVITLAGDLGAGKTTLTRFIGEGLGVPPACAITSPTFSIIHEYPGRIPLYHMDLYRLTGEDDALEAGVEEYLHGQGVAVIEWPDRLGALLPAVRLEVELTLVSETEREARFTACGGDWKERVGEMAEEAVG